MYVGISTGLGKDEVVIGWVKKMNLKKMKLVWGKKMKLMKYQKIVLLIFIFNK